MSTTALTFGWWLKEYTEMCVRIDGEVGPIRAYCDSDLKYQAPKVNSERCIVHASCVHTTLGCQASRDRRS
jgi:hypothetical protein